MKPSDKPNIVVNVDTRYIIPLAKVDSKIFCVEK